MTDLLVVCLEGAVGENWRECADVLYSVRPRSLVPAWLLAGRVLARYPGCVLVSMPCTDGRRVLRLRTGLTAVVPAAPRGAARRSH